MYRKCLYHFSHKLSPLNKSTPSLATHIYWRLWNERYLQCNFLLQKPSVTQINPIPCIEGIIYPPRPALPSLCTLHWHLQAARVPTQGWAQRLLEIWSWSSWKQLFSPGNVQTKFHITPSLTRNTAMKNPVCPSVVGLWLRTGTSVWAEQLPPADNLNWKTLQGPNTK